MLAIKGQIAIIALVYRGVSWGLVVLLESLRTAEPLVALITLAQRGMNCGVEVLVERLLAAKGSSRNHRTRILEHGLGS